MDTKVTLISSGKTRAIGGGAGALLGADALASVALRRRTTNHPAVH